MKGQLACVLAVFGCLAFSGPVMAQGEIDTGLPADFFRTKPPVNERDILIYEQFLRLLKDDTFERGFLEAKLAKDFKVKPERVRYAAMKISIIVMLEVDKATGNAAKILPRVYGPEALPTEEEIELVRPLLGRFAAGLNRLTPDDVRELPWMYFLYKL